MKSSIIEIPSEPTFKPLRLTIDLETEEELKALRELMWHNQSIPKYMEGYMTLPKKQSLALQNVMKCISETMSKLL